MIALNNRVYHLRLVKRHQRLLQQELQLIHTMGHLKGQVRQHIQQMRRALLHIVIVELRVMEQYTQRVQQSQQMQEVIR